MPNGESREGLEDVLDREGHYLTRDIISLEETIAEMRATVIRTTQPTLTLASQTPEPRFKIPKGFTPLHPLTGATLEPDEKPEHLLRTDRVRYVLRSGEKGSSLVSQLWWGDSPRQNSSIVAYKKLKKESPWVDWGTWHRLIDLRDRPINDQVPDIARLNSTLTTPEVLVWLRDFNRPVGYVRRADAWDWGLDGTGNDIMRYRLAGEEDESITRI